MEWRCWFNTCILTASVTCFCRKSKNEVLCGRAGEAVAFTDDDLPPLPTPDKRGRFPTEEFAKISLARDVIRSR
jgi:hypothetical protein